MGFHSKKKKKKTFNDVVVDANRSSAVPSRRLQLYNIRNSEFLSVNLHSLASRFLPADDFSLAYHFHVCNQHLSR